MESAVKLLQKLHDAGEASPRHQGDLGVALRASGELLASIHRTDDARANLYQSQKLLQELVRLYPDEPQFAAELKLTDELLAELDSI